MSQPVGRVPEVPILFNLNLQESPPSKQSERWRGMEERSSDVIRLQ